MVTEMEKPRATKPRRAAAAPQLLPTPGGEEVGGNIFAQGSGENPQMNTERKHDTPPIFTPVNFVIVDDAVPRNAAAWNHDTDTGAPEQTQPAHTAPNPILWTAAVVAIVVAGGLALLSW